MLLHYYLHQYYYFSHSAFKFLAYTIISQSFDIATSKLFSVCWLFCLFFLCPHTHWRNHGDNFRFVEPDQPTTITVLYSWRRVMRSNSAIRDRRHRRKFSKKCRLAWQRKSRYRLWEFSQSIKRVSNIKLVIYN